MIDFKEEREQWVCIHCLGDLRREYLGKRQRRPHEKHEVVPMSPVSDPLPSHVFEHPALSV